MHLENGKREVEIKISGRNIVIKNNVIMIKKQRWFLSFLFLFFVIKFYNFLYFWLFLMSIIGSK